MLGGENNLSMESSPWDIPWAMPTNGAGDAAPLVVYPPGMDLSGFVIYDPASSQWVS
jgi:hypothetical protein